MKDHTGKQLKTGQKATMDSGHSHCDDREGEIVEKNGVMYFVYADDGDEIQITPTLCGEIEINFNC